MRSSANTDRHHENWAVIRYADEDPVMAPSFDHASSLGFNEPPDRCEARLATMDQGYSVRAYAERGRGKFEGRPALTDLALEALRTLSGTHQHYLEDRLAGLSRAACADILDGVPAGLMSHASRTFALEILRINQERLLYGLDHN